MMQVSDSSILSVLAPSPSRLGLGGAAGAGLPVGAGLLEGGPRVYEPSEGK